MTTNKRWNTILNNGRKYITRMEYLRRCRGWSVNYVSKLTGISYQIYKNWERDKYKPNKYHQELLQFFWGVPFDFLIDRLNVSDPQIMVKINFSRSKYGKLTPIRFIKRDPGRSSTNYYWEFQCDCGRKVVLLKGNVIDGNTSSCGCGHALWKKFQKEGVS